MADGNYTIAGVSASARIRASIVADFESDGSGVLPSGWSYLQQAYTNITVETHGTQVVVRAAAAGNGTSNIKWDALGTYADVDFIIDFQCPSTKSDPTFGFRAYGTAPNHYQYQFVADMVYNKLSLWKTENGAATKLGTDADVTFTQGEWWKMRVQATGTALKCKVWKSSDSEPGTWNREVTDSAITALGLVTIGSYVNAETWFDNITFISGGALTFSGTASIPLSEVHSTPAVGTVTATFGVSVELVQVSSTAAVEGVEASGTGDGEVELLGVEEVAAVEAVEASAGESGNGEIALDGVEATAELSGPEQQINASFSLPGLHSLTWAGTLVTGQIAELAGVSVDPSLGDLGLSHSSSVALRGLMAGAFFVGRPEVYTEEPDKDFWFQIEYINAELRDVVGDNPLVCPILASGNKSSLSIARAREEAPNTVEVTFYDQTDWINKPVRYESLAVRQGTEQPRVLAIQALSVPSASCAYRLARQWYYLAQRTLRVGCTIGQQGVGLAPGDVVGIVSDIGPLATFFRVRSIQRGLGTFALEMVEYAASDYSTEEAITLDTYTIPKTEDRMTYMSWVDDFTSGGTESGYVGQLGWTLGTYTYVGYGDETNHPGIVNIYGIAYGLLGLSYGAGAATFVRASPWSTYWVFKPGGIYYQDLCAFSACGVEDVFRVGAGRISQSRCNLFVDNADTGVEVRMGSDWFVMNNSCDGTTAQCSVTRNGIEVYRGTKSPGGGYAYLNIFAYQAMYAAGSCFVDKVRLSIGVAR